MRKSWAAWMLWVVFKGIQMKVLHGVEGGLMLGREMVSLMPTCWGQTDVIGYISISDLAHTILGKTVYKDE